MNAAFYPLRRSCTMWEKKVNAFATHLAAAESGSASAQTQALCAALFLYRPVLGPEVGELVGLVRQTRPKRLSVALARG